MLIGIDANEANLTKNRVGVNQYAFNLLHALYREPRGHEFVIYLKTPVLPDLPKARPGWQYRVIPFPKLWTQTRLPLDLFLHQPRPDVFFSTTHYAPRWSPIPTVIAVMDLGFLLYPEQNRLTKKDFYQLKNWTAYSVKNAAKVIAISENTKKDIVRIYHKPAKDVAVTYLGFDNNVFKKKADRKVLEKYHIQQPYFLFLSSLKPSKNVEGLIRAFAQFPQPNYSLVIAGKKAWLYEQIFNLAKELKLQKRVVFTGFIENREAPVLMSMASGFVLPSFYEGFALPALEAMACGTPVAVSQVANLPEVAGDAVVYLDPNSVASITHSLEELVGPKREKFVQAGLNRVKLFSWANTARDTLKVLESVCIKK